MNYKLSKYYDKFQSQDYESRRNNSVWKSEIEIFHQIKHRLAAKYDGEINILDVPVGTGRWIPYLDDIACRYVGVDISENMLEQAEEKLKDFPAEVKKRFELIASSVEELPNNVDGTFELILSTRFLPHFSLSEGRQIMNVFRCYSKGDLIIMVRVADNWFSIFMEIFDFIIRSPIGGIKRYFKAGRLSYTKLDSDYEDMFMQSGFHIVRKNLVYQYKRSRFEYWELNCE